MGINGYKQFLRQLIQLFAILSILSLPISYVYSTGEGYSRSSIHNQDSSLLKYSLGNMGYSSKQCMNQLLMSDKIHMTCPYGHLSSILTNGLGINTNINGETSDFCVVDEMFQNDKCQEFLHRGMIDSLFSEKCQGKSSCQIGLTNDILKGF